eukprot:745898-Hanusia_phi.AAC.3
MKQYLPIQHSEGRKDQEVRGGVENRCPPELPFLPRSVRKRKERRKTPGYHHLLTSHALAPVPHLWPMLLSVAATLPNRPFPPRSTILFPKPLTPHPLVRSSNMGYRKPGEFVGRSEWRQRVGEATKKSRCDASHEKRIRARKGQE